MTKKRLLFTGGTGFLGKNAIPALRKNYEVISVGSQDVDLCSQTATNAFVQEVAPDIIVHAAGKVGGIAANQINPGKFMYSNLCMGMNIIHAAMIEDVERFVMLGTVCSYPKHTPVPFRESDIWNGYPEETNAPYGIAKKTLMKMVETYHEQYGLNGINLIPVNMYGPHDHFNLTSSHVIPALILKVHRAISNNHKKLIVWGTGEASREFLYVKDCVEAIRLAVNTDRYIGPSPVNIGTGKEIRIKDLVEMICDKMGFDGKIVYDPNKPDGQPRRCLDVSSAAENLGFCAETSLKTGLSSTIKWFMKHKDEIST